MIKISTLLAVAGVGIASAQIAHAQVKESPWTFGVKAGVSIPTNKNVDDRFLSLDLGGTVEYQLQNGFYLSSGLEFIGKGVSVTDQYTTTTVTLTGKDILKTENSSGSNDLIGTFMQIPLTIAYRLPLSNSVNLTARGGMYAAYKIYDGSKISHIKRDGVNNFDFGLLGGVGIEYKRFSIDANYEFGLTNLRKNADNYYSEQETDNSIIQTKLTPSKWKNRNVSVTVGYKF